MKSQSQKDITSDFTCLQIIHVMGSDSMETTNTWRLENGSCCFSGRRVSFYKMKELEMNSGDGQQ